MSTDPALAQTTGKPQIPFSQFSAPIRKPEQAPVAHTRLTKIVCTLGPASCSEEVIRKLILAGANVFRLNFSHGTHESHTQTLNLVRKVSKELGRPVGVLQDLCGPKVRISEVPDGKITLAEGERVKLVFGEKGSRENGETVIATKIVVPQNVLKAGHRVLLADGRIQLSVTEVGADSVSATVEAGGELRTKAGLAMPDSELSLPAITEKDKLDLEWGLKHGVNYVALSFVRSGADVCELRELMRAHGEVLPIVSKIERKCALEVLPEILDQSDAVMVARGDLGTEIPIEEIPEAQELIVEAALQRGIPCIVATEMLMSMVASEMPTRGDITDVSLAARSGTDAVMLSQETAIGNHPVQSVRTMAQIVDRGENKFEHQRHLERMTGKSRKNLSDREVVALSACSASVSSGIHCIVAFSRTGETARAVAKYRPQVPVFAASNSEETLATLSLVRGVIPLGMEMESISNERDREQVLQSLARSHFALNKEANDFAAIVVSATLPHSAKFEIRRFSRQEICAG